MCLSASARCSFGREVRHESECTARATPSRSVVSSLVRLVNRFAQRLDASPVDSSGPEATQFSDPAHPSAGSRTGHDDDRDGAKEVLQSIQQGAPCGGAVLCGDDVLHGRQGTNGAAN